MDPGLDPGTAERMLRGERAGPPKLANLLAAAAFSDPEEGGLEGERAAVAAFGQARRSPGPQAWSRRLSALVTLKAALLGLLFLLTGGLTVAVASQHLPGRLGHGHSHRAGTPTTTGTLQTRTPPAHPPRTHEKQTPTPRGTRPTGSAHPAGPGVSAGPRPTAGVPGTPDHTKNLLGKVPKTPGLKIPAPKSATRSAPAPLPRVVPTPGSS